VATLAELVVGVKVDADDIGTGVDDAVDKAERSLGRLDDAADKAGASVDRAGDRASRAFSGVDASVDRAGTALRGVGDDAERAATDVEGAGRRAGGGFTSGISSAMSSLGGRLRDSASNALDDLKGEFAIGGAVAGAALIAAASTAMDREAAGGDTLAFRLGLDPAESERLGRLAGDIYTSAFGDSFEQVRDAVDAVKSSLSGALGPADRDLRKITEQALNLAQGFGVDVVEAAGIAGFAVQHGLAGDADHAMDLITAAMQRMPASMREELFPAIEEYGSFLHNLGLTGEEAFGLLAAASQEGSFGIDKTADALKELTIRAVDMSTTSVGAFEAAGFNADEMAARFIAGGDSARGALDDLIDGLLGIEDPVERQTAAIGLFGTPLEDLSTAEIPEFLRSLDTMTGGFDDVSGAAERSGAMLADNTATRWEEFKRRAIDGIVTAADTYLLPALERIVAWARNNPMAFQLMTVAVAALAAGFLALAIAAAIATLAAAPWIMTALLVAGIVAGLILVIGLLIIYWDELGKKAGEVWDWIKLKATQAKDWVINVWRQSMDFLKNKATEARDWVQSKWDGMIEFLRTLPGRAASAVDGMWDGFVEETREALNRVIRWWNGITFPEFTTPTLSTPLGDLGGWTIGGWDLPNISELATGGIVRATPGGTLARIGEGRHDEAVVPLPDGMRSLRGGGGGPGIVVNVAGSILSERELEEVIFDAMRRGGFGGAR
jgi:hypothetical protein